MITLLPSRRSTRSRARIAALTLIVGTAPALAQTDVRWANPTNGTWSTASSWNPAVVPNNAGPNTFNAIFDTLGPAYQCDLDIDVTLSNLSLTSPNATLNLGTPNTINVLGNYTQQAATVVGSPARSATTSIGGTATFRGTTLMHAGRFAVTAGIVCDTDPGTDVDICDTDIDASGVGSLTGNGSVLLGAGSRFSITAGASFTITADGGFAPDSMANNSEAINVAGTFRKLGSAGNSQITGIRLNNSGTIDVSSGTLTADNTLTANTLPAGGAWVVRNNATLDFASQTLSTNQASITLNGSNANFTQLASLSSNAAGASITLANGKAQTFSNALTNAGTLATTGLNSSITASNTLTNSGTIALSGANTSLTTNAPASNSGNISMNANAGRINANASLTNSGTISITGGNAQLVVAPGASLTNNASGSINVLAGTNSIQSAGNITNNGRLTLGAGTALNITGAGVLTNYNPVTRTLSGGTFDLASGASVQFNGTSIRTLNSKVILADPTAVLTSTGADDILRGPLLPQGNQSDLVAIGPSGELALGSGEDFNSSASSDFSVAPGGRLSIGAGSEFTVPAGNNLTNFNGGIFQDGTFSIQGTLRADNLAIHTIDNNLTLDGPASVFENSAGQDALTPLNTVGSNGSFTIANNRSVTTAGPLTVQSGGTLALNNGSLTTGGDVTINGTLQGSGTLNGAPVINGLWNPGNSPGLFTVLGNTLLNDQATLRIELAGLAAGTQHDQIVIRGALNFESLAAATLDVVLLSGFSPQLGDTFDIITHREFERHGEFARYRGLTLSPWTRLEVLYLSDRIQLVVVPAPGVATLTLLGLASAPRRRRS
jgi:hypothetical protein